MSRFPVLSVFLFGLFASCGGAEDTTVCSSFDCSGHGVCEIRDALPECACDDGYHSEGLSCIEDGTMGPCASVDCGSGGNCVVENGQASCACLPGYEANGETCVAAACLDVACSGHGECVVADGIAACSCEPGYRADGSDCLVDCDPWANDETFAIDTVEVGGAVTINGRPLFEPIDLRFESSTGNRFSVTITPNGLWNDKTALRVAQATYEVWYVRRADASAFVPLNSEVHFATVDLNADATLDLDLKASTLRGHVAVRDDGLITLPLTMAADDASQRGSVALRANEPDGRLTDLSGANDKLLVADGQYQLGFWQNDRWIRRVETVLVSGDTTVAIDEQLPTLEVEVQVNGERRIGPGEGHTIYLRDASGDFGFGGRNLDAAGKAGSMDLPFYSFTGTHDVFLGTGRDGEDNDLVLLGDITVVGDSNIFALSVVGTDATIEVVRDQKPDPGAVLLLRSDLGEQFRLTTDEGGVYRTADHIVPIRAGRYRVTYTGTTLLNRAHDLGEVELRDGQTTRLNILTTTPTGVLTVNGSSLHLASPQAGLLRLRSERDGGEIALDVDIDGSIRSPSDSARVVAGEYEIFFANRTQEAIPVEPGSPPLPDSTFVSLGIHNVESALTLDVKAVPVEASVVTTESVAPAGGDLTLVSLGRHFDDAGFETTRAPIVGGEGRIERTLLSPGAYDLAYEPSAINTSSLANDRVALGCRQVQARACDPVCCLPGQDLVLVPERRVDVLFLVGAEWGIRDHWQELLSQLTIIPQISGTPSMGLLVAPSRFESCGIPDALQVPLGPNRADQIVAAIEGSSLKIGFPMHGALAAASDALVSSPSGAFIVLIFNSPPEPKCGELESEETVLQQVTDLATNGIRTMVVSPAKGFSSSFVRELALAGGMPKTADQPHYALSELPKVAHELSALSPRASGCRYRVPDWASTESTTVMIDEREVPHSTESGWALVPDESLIEFRGPWCELLTEGGIHQVTANIVCEPGS